MNTEVRNTLRKEPKEYSDSLHHYASPELKEIAGNLRRCTTEAEDLLWNKLKNKKLNGEKFRRQHALYKFVADFYCHEHKLVIELDGEIHNQKENKEKDESRTYALEQLGLKIIRFKNEEVVKDIRKVLNIIKTHLATSPSL